MDQELVTKRSLAMKTLYLSYLTLIGAFAFAGAAYAQQPTDIVTSDGLANTAMGTNALLNVSDAESGCHNTASGMDALYSDIGGSYNTATGFSSLYSNTSGNNNTAAGYESLYFNSTGNDNTASGYQALYTNTTGNNNTATGYQSLYYNSTGSENTVSGYQALYTNTTGSYNTAFGVNTLFSNATGNSNSAFGFGALYANTTGNFNTASGTDALYSNTSGSSNIAEGFKAGYNLTTGSNNIDIGNPGVAGESGIIRIGTQVPTALQTNTYIAGIYTNTTVSGLPVVVDSNGQLGVGSVSSERFKTEIAPMGSTSEKLKQLRPVTFHLKTNPEGALQFGLIAEEVAEVYPELVVRDPSGRVDGLRYDELAPMLLNEVQKRDAAQDERNASQEKHIAEQDAKINLLMGQLAEMRAAFVELQRKDERLVQR
jgi:hypothetical protein